LRERRGAEWRNKEGLTERERQRGEGRKEREGLKERRSRRRQRMKAGEE